MSEYRFLDVDIFSHAKSDTNPNEDAVAIVATAIAVADGATAKLPVDLAPPEVDSRTVANIVAEQAVAVHLNGPDLVAALNAAVAAVQGTSPTSRASSCTLACARICGDLLAVTIVGDTSVRINGAAGTTYTERNLIDELTTSARAHYISLTGDVSGSRDFIMPLLTAQSAYRNNAAHPLGFGVIDGNRTPNAFIRTINLPLAQVHSVELFTDGYPTAPNGTAVEDWEQAYADVIHQDPDRCRSFPATKPKDDRTVVVAAVRRL